MIINNDIKNQYFNWIINVIFPNENIRYSYSKLLRTLYYYDYIPSMDRDENRKIDGINFRKLFLSECGFPDYLINEINEPCSMLEMMASLAFRIENSIMYDPSAGDRISFWFLEMLKSLGLYEQNDISFDNEWVNYRIMIFNTRQYDANGKGSLFTISDPNIDMRDHEIWYQMNLYLVEYDNKQQNY